MSTYIPKSNTTQPPPQQQQSAYTPKNDGSFSGIFSDIANKYIPKPPPPKPLNYGKDQWTGLPNKQGVLNQSSGVQKGTDSSVPQGADESRFFQPYQANPSSTAKDPFTRSRYGVAYGEMPQGQSAWLTAQLGQNKLAEQQARDAASESAASGLGTGLSSLSRSGGLNSGARERMANLSGYNNMMGNQNAAMRGAQNAQSLRAQDYTNRVDQGRYEDRIFAANEMANAMRDGQTGGNIEDTIEDYGKRGLSNAEGFRRNPFKKTADFAGGIVNDFSEGDYLSGGAKVLSTPFGGSIWGDDDTWKF